VTAVALDQFGDFRLIRQLGESGGFGAAYEAIRGGERCVVKIFHGEVVDGVALARFQREVKTQQRVSHPNLIEYLDSGVTHWQGRQCHWISMRYLEGRTLRDELRANGGRLAPDRARRFGAQAAAGLGALHDVGVVHRDLKPTNIFICTDGRVVLLDYGIALFLDYTSLTERGRFVGTWAYAAPEQLVGDEVPATDLYSLGVVLYEAITGRVPFSGRVLLELVHRIQNDEPEPPSSFSTEIPVSLEQLILWLMAKQAHERPHTARDVEELLRGDAASVAATKPQPYDRSRRPLLFVRAGREKDPLPRACSRLCHPDVVIASIADQTARREARRVAGYGNALFAVDPFTFRFGSANFALSSRLASVGFAPADGIQPFQPGHFRDLEASRAFAADVVDHQVDAAATFLFGAAFVIRSIDDPWLVRTAKLLEESVRRRDVSAPDTPLFAPLPLAIEAFITEEAQSRLVNKLSRANVDGYVLMFDQLEEASPPALIVAAVRLALLLQQTGRPVVVARAGSLRHVFLAFGIAGVELGLGRYAGFRLSDFQARRPFGASKPRFEFSSLLMTATPELASKILNAGVLPETNCACPGCGRASDAATRIARTVEHDAATYEGERIALADMPASQRVEVLERAVSEGLGYEAELRRANVLSGRLEHLRIWPKAISAALPYLEALEARRRAA
jgi:hypothetical protein